MGVIISFEALFTKRTCEESIMNYELMLTFILWGLFRIQTNCFTFKSRSWSRLKGQVMLLWRSEKRNAYYWRRKSPFAIVETESETLFTRFVSGVKEWLASYNSIKRFPRTQFRHYLLMQVFQQEWICFQIKFAIEPCNILLITVDFLAHDYITF